MWVNESSVEIWLPIGSAFISGKGNVFESGDFYAMETW